MTAREHTKYFLAGATITIYALCPGYRYFVIGSWFAYQIMQHKQRYQVVPKQSKLYRRIMKAG